MPNIPKPELERGNYLVYTDEPDTVYDSAGGGGGGGGGEPYELTLVARTLTDTPISDYENVPFFTIGGEQITGFAKVELESSNIDYVKTVTVTHGPDIYCQPVEGFTNLDGMTGGFELVVMGSEAPDMAYGFPIIARKHFADLCAAVDGFEVPTILCQYTPD